ncbi:MAG: hypothetical protein R6W06_04860 [Prochlorococcaceae cyanobacterium]
MAVALQLGVDLIATAYGGNTDFCTGPIAHPCADGHVWGEPDLDHAAELMQQVAARRLALVNDREAAAADPSRDPEVLAAYRQRFSWAAAGARYRARLEELWGQRRELGERLKWGRSRRFEGGGWPVVAEGVRPPQALETPVETRMLSRLVLTYYEGIRPGAPSLR